MQNLICSNFDERINELFADLKHAGARIISDPVNVLELPEVHVGDFSARVNVERDRMIYSANFDVATYQRFCSNYDRAAFGLFASPSSSKNLGTTMLCGMTISQEGEIYKVEYVIVRPQNRIRVAIREI